MVAISQTQPDCEPAVEDAAHRERRHALREARRFRLDQLVALEGELADTPQESVTRALHHAATAALAEIDAALRRLADGVYGRCVTCSRSIPGDRLDVLPMAAQCMPCHFHDQNKRP